MIKVLLWDIDGTLLNFDVAEEYAIQKCFSLFGFGKCTEEMLLRYSVINKRYWERLEAGELTLDEVLVGRYEEFFEKEGLPVEKARDFNEEYQLRLGDSAVYCDNGEELVKKYKGIYKQYIVTNGTFQAQDRKLKHLGLYEIMDDIFISEKIGAGKPTKEFFDVVWKKIGTYNKDEVLIIGDSLTSDIQGGINEGILTCWYNPKGVENTKGIKPTYEIRNLNEIEAILAQI